MSAARSLIVAVVLAVFALGAAAGEAAATTPTWPDWPACVPRTAPAGVGVKRVGRRTDGRLVTLELKSRAMGDVQPVRVLLPAGYRTSSARRYPVLYLLHGSGGDYRSWMDTDRVGDRLGGMQVITVMPNGSETDPAGKYQDGNYSDWFGLAPGAPGQAPAWESFHIRELVPYIDSHFRTQADAAGRAIAGISMGGGGATKYAAEYPGTFGYAGTFSGEADPLLPLAVAVQSKTCKWGDPGTQEVVWRDNDSTNLAANLRGVRLFVRSGDGTPGPYDEPAPEPGTVAAVVRQVRLVVEYGAYLENQAFVAAARTAGVRHINARFFPGSHSAPYWQRDLAEFLPWLRGQLRHPPHAPTPIRVESAHSEFTAWGWRFSRHRRVREFVYLKIKGNRLTATGSGGLSVLTPRRFQPGHSYSVLTGGRARNVTADGQGRLAFTMSLGPSHTHQQTRFDKDATRGWRTATARIGAGPLWMRAPRG